MQDSPTSNLFVRARSLAAPALCSALALFVAALSACRSNEVDNTSTPVDPSTCTRPATCTPDPGAKPADCETAEQGLEFATIWDFETGVGDSMYRYSDGTFLPSQPPRSTYPTSGWQPPATPVNRCMNKPATQALHFAAGPFYGWGGGLGVGLSHLYSRLCAITNPDPSKCRQPMTMTDPNTDSIDVSQWDGVSLWARRAPDGQELLRVLVGTKDTDDDQAYLALYNNTIDGMNRPLYCQRVRDCSCLNHKACTYFPDATTTDGTLISHGFFCGDPTSDPTAAAYGGAQQSNWCGGSELIKAHPELPSDSATRCDSIYPAFGVGDPQFFGKPCTQYTFRNGVSSGYCYDPKTDPPPAEPDQQCGDHFTFPISLTTDWRFYKVPFSEMFQQGFAQRAKTFDLTTVSVVRLTWDSGYIDFEVDDVKFYREKR